MWVKELYLKNWMIVREANLAFSRENNIIGVMGRYAESEDGGRSNRSGKTTVIEAIRYLLFGRGRTTSGARLVNRTAREQGEGFLLMGTFVLSNGSELTVSRARDSKGKATVEIEGLGEVGWEAANNHIEELIGFTNEEFGNTCHFEQGNIHKFMEASPSDKRELLLHWLNQDRWERRRLYMSELSSVESRRLDTIRSTSKAIGEVSKDVRVLEADVKRLEGRVRKLKSTLSMRQQRVKKLREELDRANQRKGLLDDLRNLQETLRGCNEAIDRINQNASKVGVLNSKIDSLQGEQRKAREITTKYVSETSRLLGGMDANIESLEVRVGFLDDANGVCPLLHEGCDRISGSTIKDSEDELGNARADRKRLVDSRKKEEKALRETEANLLSKIKEATVSLRGLGQTDTTFHERTKKKAEADIARVEAKLEGLQARSVNVVDNDLIPTLEGMEQVEGQLEAALGEQGNAEAELSNAKAMAKKRAEILREMDECSKEASSMAYCSFMFSNRGIPGEYIKASFQTLETDINYILRRMGTTVSVEFRPYREAKDQEPSCLVCGNQFKAHENDCEVCGEPRAKKRIEQLVLNITDHAEGGMESDFSMDSGGGQVLISFAVRLALLMLKIRSGNCEVPPIILDEVVGFLDIVNRRAVIDVVVNILTTEFGVEQVWWISHNEEILDMLESSLVVTRYGDHSIVDWM